MKLLRSRPNSGLPTDYRNELQRWFEDFMTPQDVGVGLAMPMDVTEDKDNFYVHMELPGIDPANVEVSFTDGTLTVSGEKKEEIEHKEKNLHHVERRYGSFTRSAAPSAAIDGEKITAEFEKGVLKVTLPKKEEAKPKTITIKPVGK